MVPIELHASLRGVGSAAHARGGPARTVHGRNARRGARARWECRLRGGSSNPTGPLSTTA
eukprot:1073091-Alexandrium_andersonii.AAC.1